MKRNIFLFLRFLKNQFYRFSLHKIFGPFENMLLYLAYGSKLSRWIRQNPCPQFNDFYSPEFDYIKRYKLYEFVLNSADLRGAIIYLEFGVYAGESLRWWLEHNSDPRSKFYGFDTFTGLPENWGHFNKGDMSMASEAPQITDNRNTFIKGLFQETLENFLQKTDLSGRKVIHLDADLYTSTLYVLTCLSKYLRQNDIIIFDEFNIPTDEFRAFLDFSSSYRRNFELIASTNNYFVTAFKIV